MAKARQTVTSCDLEACDELFVGDQTPDGWLKVSVKPLGQDGRGELLTFCSYTDLGIWADENVARLEADAEHVD